MNIARNIVKLCVILALVFLVAGVVQPVNATGEDPDTSIIIKIKKKAEGSMMRTWTWNIEKSVDQNELTLSEGQTQSVNYSVTVSAVEDDAWTMRGRTSFRNYSDQAVTIESVQDILSNGMTPTLTCWVAGQGQTLEFPFALLPESVINCDFSVTGTGPAPVTDQAIVTADGVEYYGDIAITYIDETITDECATVNDTMAGYLGDVCASDTEKSFSFEYPKEIGGYDECGEYMVDNIASFTTNDTSTTGEAGASVKVIVPCGGGCTLTYGYWQTHSKYGPAPYDNTWDAKDGGDAEFLGTGVSYYEILQTKPKGGNAFYILAHQYIAAEMNGLNGAGSPSEVQDVWSQAQGILEKYEADLAIPKKSVDTDAAIALAGILDAYNNGSLGPGHCE
jgi:hypothetical protein